MLVCTPCGFIQQVWEFVGIRFPLNFFVVVCKNGKRKHSRIVCSYSMAVLQVLPRFLCSKSKACLLTVALSVSACLLSLYMLRAFHSLGLAIAVRYSANLYSLCRPSLKLMRDLQCWEQHSSLPPLTSAYLCNEYCQAAMSLTSHRSERSEVRFKVTVENFKVRLSEK